MNYAIEITPVPPDSHGERASQYVIRRAGTIVYVGRSPRDPDGFWAERDGRHAAKSQAAERSEQITALAIARCPDAPLFEHARTPPVVS